MSGAKQKARSNQLQLFSGKNKSILICQQEEELPNQNKQKNKDKPPVDKRKPHLMMKQTKSQQKRVRLKDYLFTARSSAQKYRERQKELKKTIVDPNSLKQSLKEVRRHKYQITNRELHQLVKKDVEQQLETIINNLKQDLQYVKSQDPSSVTNEDIIYIYDVRRIVVQKIRPSMNDMREASVKRQKTLFKQVFSIGNLVASLSKNNSAQETFGETTIQLDSDKLNIPNVPEMGGSDSTFLSRNNSRNK